MARSSTSWFGDLTSILPSSGNNILISPLKLLFFHWIPLGGSFNQTGGHNPLEAIIYSKPVISGPSIKNFRDIYSILEHESAAFVVKNEKEFYNSLEKLFSDKEFYNTISKKRIKFKSANNWRNSRCSWTCSSFFWLQSNCKILYSLSWST